MRLFVHFCGGGKYRRLLVLRRWGHPSPRYRTGEFMAGPLHFGIVPRDPREDHAG